MSDRSLLYLSHADVEATALTMAEVIAAMETSFREKGEIRVEMPPKPGIHAGSGDSIIHAMPTYIPALNPAGIHIEVTLCHPEGAGVDLTHLLMRSDSGQLGSARAKEVIHQRIWTHIVHWFLYVIT